MGPRPWSHKRVLRDPTVREFWAAPAPASSAAARRNGCLWVRRGPARPHAPVFGGGSAASAALKTTRVASSHRAIVSVSGIFRLAEVSPASNCPVHHLRRLRDT